MMKNFKAIILILSLIYSSNGVCISFDDSNIDWEQSNPTSMATINHQLWSTFLKQHIHQHKGINMLDYRSISSLSKEKINQYITQLADEDISLFNQQEQKAYWINLYNALTVRLILDNYPVNSIKSAKLLKISLTQLSPWDRKLVTIKQIEFSLNNIEHQILRKFWSDSRIHYAINCASLGCPNLAKQAYTGINIEILLNQAAIEFINHPRAVMFKNDNTLILSKIFKWYLQDFAKDEIALLEYLMQYLETSKAIKLEAFNGNIIYQYDWQLNDLRKK